MRVTREVYEQLRALVAKGRRAHAEVGGFIIVPDGETGVASEFVECVNAASQAERYSSFSFADDVWTQIVDPALDRGDSPVPFHTHGEASSRLSSEDEAFMPKSTKVVHGAQGFRVYVWSAATSRYESEELVIVDSER
jgi:proteasome lid subunit RPN8/RPN11